MYKDFILNIVGSAILTIATQLLAYPYLGRMLSAEEYGIMLTAMAVASTTGVSLGNSLNNTRILVQGDYDRAGVEGDFNLLVLILAVPCIIASLVGVTLLYSGHIIYGVGTAIISLLVLMRSYYMVAFRIDINYKKVVVANTVGLCGYVVGIMVAQTLAWWPIVFILGELAILIYLAMASPLFHEKVVKTPLFGLTAKRFGLLVMATAIGQAMTYMDRFLIYPFLGADQVSVFTVASLMGKTIGIVATPIAGVLLTYYAKEGSQITLRQFWSRIVLYGVMCTLGYIVVMIASRPVLGILYPDYVEDAIAYLPLSNAGAIVMIFSGLLSPTLLKSADNKWQPIIQVVHLVAYVTLSLWLSSLMGLTGFCVGVLIANVIRAVVMVFVMMLTLKTEGKDVV